MGSMLFKIKDTIAAKIYSFFLLLWVVIWAVLCFTHNLSPTYWLWIPFLFGLGYLILAGALASFSPPPYYTADKERELLKWITDYLAAFILAITVTMLVGVYLCGYCPVQTIKANPGLLAFYRFEFLALGFVLLFVFPTYWFSDKKLGCFRWARHAKTASYLIAVFFCLAGIIELAMYILD